MKSTNATPSEASLPLPDGTIAGVNISSLAVLTRMVERIGPSGEGQLKQDGKSYPLTAAVV